MPLVRLLGDFGGYEPMAKSLPMWKDRIYSANSLLGMYSPLAIPAVLALGPAASKIAMWKAACGHNSFGHAVQVITAHEPSSDHIMIDLLRNRIVSFTSQYEQLSLHLHVFSTRNWPAAVPYPIYQLCAI
ncbi:hypothetical protein AAES_95176 [Amazona aestiva]|uniref:Uncharacterized protein n=1 Tax=Amazona aestiva TaxID=12930 RepID=A0A0Q3R557_AMAAE|nr:hypothetical protein AAES_95176 [Amazona aestiva]